MSNYRRKIKTTDKNQNKKIVSTEDGLKAVFTEERKKDREIEQLLNRKMVCVDKLTK